MTTPGTWWYHLILNARGTWLTGDPRGFRSRHHRIHSSGDYQSPPPPGEHAGLYRFVQSHARDAVRFPQDLWPALCEAILAKARNLGHRIAVMSVDDHHVHLLMAIPDTRRDAVRISGSLKQFASHQVRDRMPGRIWASSGDPIRIVDDEHYHNALRYIGDHRLKGAWVWRDDDEAQ
jgi:REP element-mobilizing transposase RayT